MMKFGVIGDPIDHSLSPELHAWLFDRMNLVAVTEKIPCRRDELENIIDLFREGEWTGLNVTIPLKREVMKFIDDLEPAAEKLGAVNCLVRQEGKITGINTDRPGFSEMLNRHKIIPNRKSCLVLGSGGAARTAVSVLMEKEAARIMIWSRNDTNSEKLVKEIETGSFEVVVCRDEDIERSVRNADLLINCTPVGMGQLKDVSPVNQTWISQNHTLIDCIYNPLKTRFILDGERSGATVCTGLDMFIYQALYSMEAWFPGKGWLALPVEELRNYLMKFLSEPEL